MSTNPASIDSRINQIVGDYFESHYTFEAQRKELETLRDRDGVIIPDDRIEDLATLDPETFAAEKERVRRFYDRRDPRTHGRVMGSTRDEWALMQRAVAYATKHRVDYGAAKAAVSAGQS